MRISSVQLPAYALGREAARLVLEMFSGESPPPDPVLLPPLRVVPRESTGALSIGDDEMHAALQYIRRNADKGLSVTDVIRHVGGMSRRAFEVRFRRWTGTSVHREIVRTRLDRAKIMLAHPDIQIKEIAYLVGFRTARQFSTVFKTNEGISPQVYRQHCGASKAR